MSLIQLPEEVLVQIFSNAILDSTDLANLAVSCRRLNSTALLSLYEDIKLKCDGPSRFRKLDLLIAILESHPIRASRVRSLDISWKEDTPEITNKISNLLHKLLTLENLTLNISNATSNYYSCHRTFSNPLDNLHTWPFASLLHTLTISDQKMNILDIGTIFTLPNLKHLSISRFDTTATEGISSAMLALAPPLCKLKTLAVWWSSHPRGWRAQYLLRGHSCLESLTWVCGHGFPNTRTSWSNGPLSPTDMFKLLEPMSDTLVHLRLSADLACYGGPEIDFSRFPALKILHVNYHSLFLMSEDTLVGENNMRRYTLGSREGLWGRLPRLLEDLRINFQSYSRAFRDSAPQFSQHPDDYGWLLALAEQKTHCFKNLSSVRISEQNMIDPTWPYAEEKRLVEEWNYPEDVTCAFEKARIELKVLTRVDSK